jgi:phosphotransferase system enzyme I (PtsI)
VQSIIHGIPASKGIVVGQVHLLHWERPDVRPRVIADDEIDQELASLHGALARAKERLRAVRERAVSKAGEAEGAIFDVQHHILEDADLIADVEALIRQNHGAEKAFDIVMEDRRHIFSRHSQPMIRERVGDLDDVHIRVLSLLLGLPDHDPLDVPAGARVILVTHDLTPGLTIQLDRNAIAAIATDSGTRTSHVAILARSLGIPAVVGLRRATRSLKTGDHVVLDGSSGMLLVSPTAAEVEAYRRRAVKEEESDAELRHLAHAEPITLDGVRVVLRANVDRPEEAEEAASSGAEGVGLMRTEFLVVGRATMPDEEEQYRAYSRVLRAFNGAPVVIRTFDVGGDKLPIGGFPAEPNPFLGWRAIRMCLDEKDLFRTQLRALLRAGLHGDLRIMLPLIVSLDEIRETRHLLLECATELEERGESFKRDVSLGIMVETPAAAVAADVLAEEVDFFSIGTNDLVQYTLAVDRGNANLASRFTALHPAVLRLIRSTVDVARDHNLDLGVCGEMASQPLMAFALIGLGLRQLSVAPRNVALIKRLVRGISSEIAREAVDAALRARTAADAEHELRRRLHAAFGEAHFLEHGLPAPADENNIRHSADA